MTPVTIPYSSSLAWSGNTGNLFVVTLTGDTVFSNPAATTLGVWATYEFIIKQDSTGLHTMTFGTAFRFPNGDTQTLSTDANAIDIMTGISDGTNIFVTLVQNFSSL